MALTRLQLVDATRSALERPDDDTFKTWLNGRVDQVLFMLWDMHDWNFKHKVSSFPSVVGTESYDIPTAASITDFRSSQDIEFMFDSTNGIPLNKVDLRDIRRAIPKIDQTSTPEHYAPWGSKTIYFDVKPDAINTYRFLYISKPTLPTADGHDLEIICGLPDYIQYLVDKMLLAEGMLYTNDDRRNGILDEIRQIYAPNAIKADMKHLESSARFKFWEEELEPTGRLTFDQYVASILWSTE